MQKRLKKKQGGVKGIYHGYIVVLHQNMESESCQSSVANVIYNLRKKIEPDSKNPTYIKTVLGIGYKFSE